jgi:hypothetical protein
VTGDRKKRENRKRGDLGGLGGKENIYFNPMKCAKSAISSGFRFIF